jgi:hypothetical protein
MKSRLFLSNVAAVAGIIFHLVLTPVYADQQRPPRDERRGPPVEAFTACENLQENDACSFIGRNDEMLDGVCVAPPPKPDQESSSLTLACRPNNMHVPPEGAELPDSRND